MYINHNDYELIYLIKDGNELAYKYLFNKYKVFIYKVVSDNVHQTDKRNDVIQECLMVLDKCIWCYNDSSNVSFYSYLYISIKRKINSILASSYLEQIVFLNEEIYPSIYNNIIGYRPNTLLDPIEKAYYDDCIIGNMSTNVFVQKHNISYYQALKIRKAILDKIKKHIE